MPTRQEESWNENLIVTERDLRRLVDVVSEKMRSFSSSNVDVIITYTLASGSDTSTESIDELFFDDNNGSRSIQRVSIGIRNENDKYVLEVTFLRKPFNESAAFFTLYGEDRDHVLILSSEIKERIDLFKQTSIVSLKNSSKLAKWPLAGVFVLVCVFFVIIVKSNPMSKVEEFLAKNPEKSIENLFDLVALSQISGRMASSPYSYPLITGMVLLLIVASFLILFGDIAHKPRCEFIWGDYSLTYAKTKKRREFYINGIGMALILGVISSWIASQLFG